MFTTSEMLSVLSKLRPNRCKQIKELGQNVYAVYLDGSYQILKPNNHSLPSLNGIEQSMLVRSMYQTILGSGYYLVRAETIRKHRLLYQVWVEHNDIEATGFAEEVDLSDALLRAFIQVLEVESILHQESVESNPIFKDDEEGVYSVSPEAFVRT